MSIFEKLGFSGKPAEEVPKEQVGTKIERENLPPAVLEALKPAFSFYRNMDDHGRLGLGDIYMEDLGEGRKRYVISGVIEIRTDMERHKYRNKNITIRVTTENDAVIDTQSDDKSSEFYGKE
ncbi:MAG: hypothetical protein WCV69_04115 [Patescibacteria group bacterium]|jgi:hypothetical protein